MLRVVVGLSFAGIAVLGAEPIRAAEERAAAPALLLKVDKKAYPYSLDQLKAMATVEYVNFRGTKRDPAVPLDVLVTRDTRLSPERIRMVVVIGETRVLVIEGERLTYLKDLVLKFGANTMSLAPRTPEAEQALRPLWGKPRIEGVERIDVKPKT
jgi:hypothetical protein